MVVSATHIHYYMVCRRKLWLFSHHVSMEQTSDLVAEGKLIGQTTYSHRVEKYEEFSVELPFNDIELTAKLDYYDLHQRIVYETKKSDRIEEAHIAQLKYYLWLLEQRNLAPVCGILTYPKLKKTIQVTLDDNDRQQIPVWINEIREIISSDKCPSLVKKPFCKSCSYFEFCYVDE